MPASLEDKYTQVQGRVHMTGLQALVRAAIDQRRIDQQKGRNTGAFLSGYPGSPLGGLDGQLRQAGRHLEPLGIVLRAGLNEELAATAVNGTQLLGELAGRRHDGVTGYWYGKSPGLDRAADAVRHGNLTGTSPTGGVVAWIGDDPSSKSSTVPSSCEPLCRSLFVPLLAPGTVSELLSFSVHAVALSRYSGTWAGVKIVADVADATSSVDLDGLYASVPDLAPRIASAPPVLLPPTNLDAELDLMTSRLGRAVEYVRLAGLNRATFEPARPRVAVLGAGLAYQATLRALEQLGLDSSALDHLGVRLVQVGAPWPVDEGDLRRLLEGVETVLVVEDKLPFLEGIVKEAFYRRPDAPVVLGKTGADRSPLLSPRSSLTADDVVGALAAAIGADRLAPAAVARLDQLSARRRRAGSGAIVEPRLAGRVPYFCSGCPHNVSTKAEADQLVGVGIGCHVMVALDDGQRRGRLTGMPQMGGEGAQWLGLEPFTDDPHFIQNMGDGTFHHSGSLAVRAAVAAGSNITFRLLYNDAVAMTGGQKAEGRMDIPALTRWLAIEGVARTVITTPEPERYRRVRLDPTASVRHRDDLERVQRDLADVSGVTVVIHDDRCATEKRRLRKRGSLETPAERVWINQRVCEGCGDCGEKSTCLSVRPVETEYGRKTEIHQSSCNFDLSCVKGDCPSFVMVKTASSTGSRAAGSRAARRASRRTAAGDAGGGTTPAVAGAGRASMPEPPSGLPDPEVSVPAEVLIRMPGIGGTGVVTVSAILQMAAHLEGRYAASLEQVGLAQKGGPVVSDIRISERPITGQIRAAAASADVVLGLDQLGAISPETLAVMDPSRTAVMVDSHLVPTAAMVTDADAPRPSVRAVSARLNRAAGMVRWVDAGGLSERLFHDHMPANLVMLGAAYQAGLLPVEAGSIEQAIEINGTSVAANTTAFRWGRALIAEPAAVELALSAEAAAGVLALSAEAAAGELMRSADGSPAARRTGTERRPTAGDGEALLIAGPDLTGWPEDLFALVTARAADLAGYQSRAYALDYVRKVVAVAGVEAERSGDPPRPISAAYARSLHKLMAYKDEYEVARLHLDAAETARREAAFGPGTRQHILLHPPVLRSLGMKRKIRLGRTATMVLKPLAAGRRLRGTVFDPFGRTGIRRLERDLPGEYQSVMEQALTLLHPGNAALVETLAGLPDLIRGYEDIKLANVERYRAEAARVLAAITADGTGGGQLDLTDGRRDTGDEGARAGAAPGAPVAIGSSVPVECSCTAAGTAAEPAPVPVSLS